MYKLDLEKAEEPIWQPNCQQPLDHRKSKRMPEKTSTSASLTMLKPLTVWITTNWKILQEMRIPDHLTCLLRNLYAGQEASVRDFPGGPVAKTQCSKVRGTWVQSLVGN